MVGTVDKLSWRQAITEIPKLTEEECKDFLTVLKRRKKKGERVHDLLLRVYRRYAKLRAARERQELGIS